MAELTVQEIDISGLNPSFAAADSEGDAFINHGNTYLHVKNDDSSSHTVTLNVQKSVEFGTLSNPTVEVPAGEERIIGPFDREWFNDNDKMVHVDYDAVASVTIAVIQI